MPGFDGSRAALGLLLLAAALPAAADYKQDYARGQEAAADGNWAEVERFMQEAMAGSATPATRVRLYGQRFAPYVPQYYLGLAAYRTNDCAAAMRWFNDPQAASVIAQVADFKGVADEARQKCRSAVATEPKPTQPVAQVEPKPQPPTTPPQQPPPKPQAQPQSQPPKPTAANPPKPAVPQQQPPVATTPAVLTQALADYLSGRFSAAGRASPNGLAGKAKAHLHLIRAASQFMLAESGPAANAQSLRSQAQADVRAAKQALPGLTPDPQYFSPRFRAFFSAN